jgi:hypothetical protein
LTSWLEAYKYGRRGVESHGELRYRGATPGISHIDHITYQENPSIAIMFSNNDANSVFSDRTSVQPQTLEDGVPSKNTHGAGYHSDQSQSDGGSSDTHSQGSEHYTQGNDRPAHNMVIYDPAMKLSYVEVNGNIVGYVRGAVYQKKGWVLVLVALASDSSDEGCWVLKGPYGGGEHRNDMVSQVSECMAENTCRGTSARLFFSNFRFSLTPREGKIFWERLEHNDPETISPWIYESPGDRYRRQARQVMEEDEAMRLEEEAYRNQIENYLVPTIGGRHALDQER